MFHWSLSGDHFKLLKIQKIGIQNPPKVKNQHPKLTHNPIITPLVKQFKTPSKTH
jgi:hypothetical protein